MVFWPFFLTRESVSVRSAFAFFVRSRGNRAVASPIFHRLIKLCLNFFSPFQHGDSSFPFLSSPSSSARQRMLAVPSPPFLRSNSNSFYQDYLISFFFGLSQNPCSSFRLEFPPPSHSRPLQVSHPRFHDVD